MADKLKTWYEAVCSTDFTYLGEKPFLIIGGTALALLILWLLYRLRPRRRIRAFKGETGYVEISRHALLELVHSACEQMPEVRKPSIKIRARRKLNLSVRIRVDGTAMLRDTAAHLQTHLKDSLENNLGVERLGKIEILVTGIRASTRPKVDLNAREEEAPVVARKPVASASPPKPAPAAPPPITPLEKPEQPASPKAPETEAPKVKESDLKPDPALEPEDSPEDAEKSSDPDEKKSGPSFFEKKKKI